MINCGIKDFDGSTLISSRYFDTLRELEKIEQSRVDSRNKATKKSSKIRLFRTANS